MAANTNTKNSDGTPEIRDGSRYTYALDLDTLCNIEAHGDCVDGLARPQVIPDSTPGTSSDSWGRADLLTGSVGGKGIGLDDPTHDGHRHDGRNGQADSNRNR